ncbi:MAG TPA: hypothetical protein DD856_05700, partial [Sulfobacillus sp.]|nr:hypothetical protein [Sulfobacillus sp.]
MAQLTALHPERYEDESWHGTHATTLRQLVFGVNDGLVATVGLVAGLTFAGAGQGTVLGATLAAIFAAVVSMALGSYLSTRTEVQYHQAQVLREKREIEENPEEELNEMRQIYRGYGFSEDEIQVFLNRFLKDKKLWLNLMLRDELGILAENFENPWSNAGVMALAVGFGSLPPLIPNFFSTHPQGVFPWVIVLSALTAFLLGALTARSSGKSSWRSGLSFLAVAAVAAGI